MNLLRGVSASMTRDLRRLFPALLITLSLWASSTRLAAQSGNHSLSASKISVPSGPGSIEGLGESFEPQLNTGTYSMGLPLKLPRVRGAVQPEVALAYNSGSGNGPLGLGWRLDIPSLQRQTDKGLPHYSTNDTFVTFAGEELVALADSTFRAENESTFTRWEHLGTNGWRAVRRDGTVARYGQTSQARQDHPTLGTFRWMLESAQDLNGNLIRYSYAKDAGEIYLRAVEFGHHVDLPSSFYRLTFQYDTNRPDCLADYRGRFRCETRWRLASAMLEFEGRRIRLWRFDYHPEAPLSLLSRFTQFGDDRSVIGGQAQLNQDYLPSVTFEYSESTLGTQRQWIDLGPFQNIQFASRQADFVDVNRDGLPDVLLYEEGKYLSYLNQGPALPLDQPREFITPAFYPALSNATTRLTDLRGDGGVKVLVKEDDTYYYRAFTSATTLGAPVDYPIPGSFSISDPEVQVVDIDNDRALDFVAADSGDSTFAMVLSRAGRGSTSITKSAPSALAQSVQFTNGWQFADMNGDRMPDLAIIGTVSEGGTLFYPGQGYGEFDSLQSMGHGPDGPTEGDRTDGGLTLVDLNGDGLADLVSVRSGIVKVWSNRSGKEWSSPLVIEDDQVPFWNNDPDAGVVTALRFADLNGNGSVDLVWNDPAQGIFLRYLDLHPTNRPNVMTRMANGMGRSLVIEYRTTTDYMLAAVGTTNAWTQVPPFPIPVASAFTERDGLGNTYRTEMIYRNGYYDALEREFRGFETALRTDVGNPGQGAPSLLTEYRFDTGAVVESLKGKPLRVERRDPVGMVFDRISTGWTNRPLPLTLAANESRSVNFALQTRETTEIIERGSAPPVTLLREFEWDNYGNSIRVADYGRVEGNNLSAWDDERITTNLYTSAFPDGLSRWILGLPVREAILDETGRVISRTESFYDDEGFTGANAGAVVRGNLTLQRRSVDPAHDQWIHANRSRYDDYGNVAEIYDPLASTASVAVGHRRQIQYDLHLHTHPVTETIHVGGTTPPLVVTANYDLGLGVMTSSTDFNTNTSSYTYDTFGRISTLTKPGDAPDAPTELYTYQLGIRLDAQRVINFITASKRESAGAGTLDSRLFFDGLGRKVMVRAEGEAPGQIVVTDTVVYNDRRAVWKKYLPYFESNSLAWNDPAFASGFVESHYDSLARVTRAYQPLVDGERVFAETTYEPLARLVRDEEQTRPTSPHFGSAMRHIEDGLRSKEGAGRLRQVQEIVKLTGSGAPVGTAEAWTTTYQYDLLDQLTQITDSQGNVKRMSYDGLARLVFMNDPDRGEMHYIYDDASNLTRTTDNKGQVIQYTYDGANRIQSEDYLDTAGHSPDVRYFYDAPHPDFPGSNLRGQLAFVRDLSGEEHFSCDTRGRIEFQTKRIPDPVFLSVLTNSPAMFVNYTTRYTYDSLDRVVSLTYPDGDRVTNLYNPRGLLTRITGGPSGSILSNVTYRASAQLESIRYGNSVLTTYGYDPRLRLKDLDTDSPVAGKLIDFHYHFDGVSNIRRIDDNRDLTGQPDAIARQNTQVYDYDSLYRLTRAEYPQILTNAPGWIDYRYDRIGNMISQVSNIPHEEDGKSVTDLGTMVSGGTAGSSGRIGKGLQPGPHALTAIQNLKSTIHNRAYPYDANGNMTNIDGLTNTWDFKDRLVAVENEKMRAEYTYDYTDRRILKRVWEKHATSGTDETNRDARTPPSLTTVYINKFFEVREYDSPVKYVWNGDTRVARVTGTLTPSAERHQFLRLYAGWNLASINVGNAQAQLDPANQPWLQTAVYWTNNSPGGEFLPITASTPLPAGTVAWLRVRHTSLRLLRGHTAGDHPQAIGTRGQFYPNLSGEGLSLSSAPPATIRVYKYDSEEANWSDTISVGGELTMDAPLVLPTGEAAFAVSETMVKVQTPVSITKIRYHHNDHLESTFILSDPYGAIIEENSLYAFGQARFRLRVPKIHGSYRFCQKEYDVESDLSHFEARFLKGTLARFSSPDQILGHPSGVSISRPQGLGLYTYARNNPLCYIDQSGNYEMEPNYFATGSKQFEAAREHGVVLRSTREILIDEANSQLSSYILERGAEAVLKGLGAYIQLLDAPPAVEQSLSSADIKAARAYYQNFVKPQLEDKINTLQDTIAAENQIAQELKPEVMRIRGQSTRTAEMTQVYERYHSALSSQIGSSFAIRELKKQITNQDDAFDRSLNRAQRIEDNKLTGNILEIK